MAPKLPCALRVGGHRRGERLALREVRLLVRAEEERSCRHSGPPIVPPPCRRSSFGTVVAKKLRASMASLRRNPNSVAAIGRSARLADQADDAAAGKAVLRAVAGAEHLEFLDRVGRREGEDLAGRGVVVVEAVEQVVVVVDARAVDVEAAAARRQPRGLRLLLHARRDQAEVAEVAAVQRQLDDLRLIDDLAHGGVAGVDERRGAPAP